MSKQASNHRDEQTRGGVAPVLEGRTILVTGGTRGIGRAISVLFARAGADVIANYVRNEDKANELADYANDEGLPIVTLRADLSSAKGMGAVEEAVESSSARPLSIVHCAATGVHRSFDELTARHLDFTMALNVRAFFELVRTLSPSLEEGSTIVAVSSEGAVRAVPAYTTVGTSKGALESLARHLAAELAPRGVRVNILSPGSVPTDAWQAFPDGEKRLAAEVERTPIGRLVTLEEVAQAALFLSSPASSGLVGHTLVVDGGKRIVQ
jgi:enoyl-[acyl-carrier protein] reductase III